MNWFRAWWRRWTNADLKVGDWVWHHGRLAAVRAIRGAHIQIELEDNEHKWVRRRAVRPYRGYR